MFTKPLTMKIISIEFGTMVWSAGLSPVKFTDRLPDTIEKTKQGRLLVDPYLRVKGQEGKVWAIGDCAELEETPLPQLAQVANQQASYLANILNGKSSEATKRFQFYSLGSMASLGDGVGKDIFRINGNMLLNEY